MSVTVNLYYKGKNGAARKFAEEMVASGNAAEVRAEEGNERYNPRLWLKSWLCAKNTV